MCEGIIPLREVVMGVAAVQHDEAVDSAAPQMDAGPEAPAADLGGMTIRIEQGLAMVFGPEGDPVPPAAFIAGAAEEPEARLPIEGGGLVAAARLAEVLEAQARAPLVTAGAGGDAWLRAMLGDGPAPEQAETADHAREAGHDLTIFGRELLVRTPGGRMAILGAPGARTDGRMLQIEGPDHRPLSRDAFLRALLELAIPCQQGAAGISVAGCQLFDQTEGFVLTTPAGLRYRLLPAGDPAAEPALACLMSLEGEALLPDQIGTALGLERELAVADPWQGPPAQPDQMSLSSAADEKPGARDLPSCLTLDADGMLDLGMLHEWLTSLDQPLDDILVSGAPCGIRFSAGRLDEAGLWRLEPADLPGLMLFATPEGLRDFDLRLVACGPAVSFERTMRIKVGAHGAVDAQPSAPFGIPLVFPPPLSPRNDLGYYAVVMITGLPPGAMLSAGAPDGSGRWALMPDDLIGLRAFFPAGTALPCAITAAGITIEDRDGLMSSTSAEVIIGANALEADDTGSAPFRVALDLAVLLDAVGPERRVQAVAVAGLPPTIELSAGAFDSATACWVLRRRHLDDLHALIRDPALARLTFKATVVSSGADGGTRANSKLFDLPLADSVAVRARPVGTDRPGFFRPLHERRA